MALIALMVISWLAWGILMNPKASLIEIGGFTGFLLILTWILKVHTWPFLLAFPLVIGLTWLYCIFQIRVLDKHK